MSKLLGLCVGHSRWTTGKVEGGAISVGNVSEYAYNSDLAARIQILLAKAGVESKIFNKYEGNGYTTAMRWLAEKLKDAGVTQALELHFNSAGPSATGHEWLHYPSSVKGKALATALDKNFDQLLPEIKSRGVKSPEAGRGDAFLKLTHCPAVICEPFFGSNINDWNIAVQKKDLIALSITRGILDFLAIPQTHA